VDDGGNWVILKDGIEGGAIPKVDLVKRRPLAGDGFSMILSGLRGQLPRPGKSSYHIYRPEAAIF